MDGMRGEGRGGGGRGDVMPKRLQSGSGHHRLESCGPSNGRHKISQDRPDFFAMLRSLPSVIDDALDTLYEPNAVFSQFLGSASTTTFIFPFPFLASSCLVFSCFLSFFSFNSFFVFFCFFRFLLFSFHLFVSFFQLTCVCRACAQ